MSHMPPAWEHELHHPQPAVAANPLSMSPQPAPQPAMCTQSPGEGKVTAYRGRARRGAAGWALGSLGSGLCPSVTGLCDVPSLSSMHPAVKQVHAELQ